MGDEEIRASLEGQDGSTFSIASHCTWRYIFSNELYIISISF